MALSQPYANTSPHISYNRFGPYQIEEVLGQGAVAMVYAAKNQQGQERVLKVLMRQAAAQRNVRVGFQREFRVMRRLRHRNIVRAYQTGEVDGYFYMTLDKIDGETLDDFLQRAKKIGEQPAIRIVTQVASALDYMHREGYAHRDIKPANILMARDGRAMLFDFGTVLDIDNPDEEDSVGVYGTPAFLAPEQINDDPVDGRADLYALGIILYRMIAGRKPFYGGRSEVLEAHLHQPPPSPAEFSHVSPDLEAAILKAIEKNPDDRFQTGAEFIDALEAVRFEPEPEKVGIGQRLGRLFGGG